VKAIAFEHEKGSQVTLTPSRKDPRHEHATTSTAPRLYQPFTVVPTSIERGPAMTSHKRPVHRKPSAWFSETVDHGWRIVCVECPGSVTRMMTQASTPIVDRRPLVEALALQHRDHCSACDMTPMLAEHGNPEFRAFVDRMWEEVERHARDRAIRERRN
jgi:hypothetical protein